MYAKNEKVCKVKNTKMISDYYINIFKLLIIFLLIVRKILLATIISTSLAKSCLGALNMKFSEKRKFWPIRQNIVKIGLFFLTAHIKKGRKEELHSTTLATATPSSNFFQASIPPFGPKSYCTVL